MTSAVSGYADSCLLINLWSCLWWDVNSGYRDRCEFTRNPYRIALQHEALQVRGTDCVNSWDVSLMTPGPVYHETLSSPRAPCLDPRGARRSPWARWHALVCWQKAMFQWDITHYISWCPAGRGPVPVTRKVWNGESDTQLWCLGAFVYCRQSIYSSYTINQEVL